MDGLEETHRGPLTPNAAHFGEVRGVEHSSTQSIMPKCDNGDAWDAWEKIFLPYKSMS